MSGPADGAPVQAAAVDALSLLEHLPVGALTLRVTADNVYATWLNPAAARILGLDEALGRSLADLDEMVEWGDDVGILRTIHDLRASPRPIDWDGELIVWGESRWVRAKVTPVGTDEHGDLLLQAFLEDITERHAAQAAGRLLADELAETQRIGGVGSWTFRNGEAPRWSDEMYRIHGLAVGSSIPKDPAWYARFLGRPAYEALHAQMTRAIQDGSGYEIVHAITRADGTIRQVLSRGSPIIGPDGGVGGIRGTMIDITDLAEARLALQERELELFETQRLAQVGGWLLARDGTITWTDECFRIHGLDPTQSEPVLDGYFTMFGPAPGLDELSRLVARALETGEGYATEYSIRRPGGELRRLHARGSVVRDARGGIAGLRGSVVDMTEVVEARRALEEREAELAEAQRAAHVGSWATLADGTNRWSDEMFRIHGMDPGDDPPSFEAYGQRFGVTDSLRTAKQVAAQAIRDGRPYDSEYAITRADGTVRHLLSRGSALLDAQGRVVELRGSCVDITDLAAARQAVATSERLYHALVDSLAEAVIVQDRTGAIVMANPAASRVLGMRHDQLTGLTSYDTRWEALREDGSPYPGEEHPSMTCLRTGRPVRDALMQIAKPDGTRVWLRINASPLTDEHGEVTAAVVSFEDITEARASLAAQRRFGEELERRVVERTAELQAANTELQVFSATLSHDLRAPVRAVAGFARLLQRRHADQLDAEGAHYVDNLVTAGETMGRLIDDFLAYARLGQDGLHAEPVELAPIVSWLETTLAEPIERSGGTLRIACPLATPLGDPAMLRRMLLNLVDNAFAYARPGVPPEVVLSACEADGGVTIAVADNGRGIPPEVQEHIFEVFARVSPDQDLAHAGIGLAMVRKAARAMGSDVTVESAPGQGSTFRFTLPAAG
ncbi:MAG: PAS domain S-box protein [Chloroflexota bacterium]